MFLLKMRSAHRPAAGMAIKTKNKLPKMNGANETDENSTTGKTNERKRNVLMLNK